MRAAIFAGEVVCELGEGPLWADGRLWWFDIDGHQLHGATADGAAVSFPMGEAASAAGRLQDGRLLVVSESGLSRFDPRSGERAPLLAFGADDASTRSNDGRADRQGGFWFGTMGKTERTPAKGAIWRFCGGRIRQVRGGVAIPNAICFAPDGRRGYFADSPRRRIETWALDAEGWPVGEPEVFVDLAGTGGVPDGAVVDREGALWVALHGAGKVVRISADGAVTSEVAVGARQPTCPAFGGDLDRLYVTSAREGLDAAARAADPDAGRTFTVPIMVPGLPEPVVDPGPAA